MDTLAVDTWERLETGTPLGLDPNEEAITDYLLYELHRRYLPSTIIRNTDKLQVRKLTKSQESKVGADWEWWIGNHVDGWVCLRVQAKRNYGTRYPRLAHKVHGRRQDIMLIEECLRDGPGYLPYHVFYNGWDDRTFKPSGQDGTPTDVLALQKNKHFPHHAWQPILRQTSATKAAGSTAGPGFTIARLGSENPRWWGCAALSSYAVNAQLDTRRNKYDVDRYLRQAMPWSKLFSSNRNLYPNLRAPADYMQVPAKYTSLTDVIHWRLLADTDHSPALEWGSPRIQGPLKLESRRIYQLPEYVLSLLESERGDEASQSHRSFESWGPARTRPRRVVLTDLRAPEFGPDRT
ncbi:DUF6615 family protein [Nocardia tengchongensis]|uniref:DUF6615 family protein n=1 Tax=Nocardia tengchongensis TaxID=2055889 RepID=UPI0036911762